MAALIRSIPKRRLKPFRQVIAQGYKRSTNGRALRGALTEENDEWMITKAATVVLTSTATTGD